MEIKTYKMIMKEDVTIDCPNVQIRVSDDAASVFRHIMTDATEEYVWMLTLNVKGEITGLHEVAHGDLSSANISPREVFKRAITGNAAAIIIAHNHPSGDPTPSDDDIIATKRIEEAGRILAINLLDHIVIGGGNGNHISMRAEGFIEG